ncbi:MAG: hypothetical protein JO039_24995 [Solirubrobacterales bacterium]|nr:hypothetical protein [Solirubrobacterales bacterium]
MREQDPRVPPEVEEYLVSINAGAGALGGAIGASVGGAAPATGGHGGARGGARGARWVRTVVEERAEGSPGGRDDVLRRVAAAFPQARRLDSHDDLVRLAVPIGRTGLQHIVVDLVLRPAAGATAAPATEVRLRAYGKEGLFSRKPTAATVDKVLAAATG